MKNADDAMREAAAYVLQRRAMYVSNVSLDEIEGVIKDALRALDAAGYELRAKAPLCAPADSQRIRWMVTFDDADRGCMIFTDEDEARKAFGRASEAWNCYLWTLAAAPRLPGVDP